ncbi:CDP-diacylglycerol--glycerol-3-phosphate 3-phosphatidyltransferase [Caloranaerobacter azorensis DSM 13643]|uniref:CDP-diacylglycerol--glycerol-3-phosphate 3-phosphatidyltransferase n=1 Tax=Caloranaerobacter azorensis DSM 13643 TaxID=1121264 RepID=A0A1M5RAW3_9FIRM|nr:CDP-diacylglycerol--glycerol-3-phosphate 3-phosphatidyltransferase [Caloranaerobacter azorensis]SHH22953.1 CDP-diacylglycerol--glycerol-3-phosphate 3-phosphatidyltransferase [Caloranaerobacter azorensis DSM 13643]
MNVPNILTTIRFLFIPIFISIFYSSIENNILYATYVFILAGITDILDGYIARKYNMVTKWGTVLDPLADKLMQITVLICFTDKKYLPLWVITVIGIKEILMILGGLFLYYFVDKTVIPANKYGKIATVSFYIAILSIVFKVNKLISYLLVLAAVILTLIAFINYLIGFRKINRMNKEKRH